MMAEETAREFADFMDSHPSIFHFVEGITRKLDAAGFLNLSERDLGKVERGRKYYIVRNGSNVVAFTIGKDFIPGPDGFGIVAGHIDAVRAQLKPSSIKKSVFGNALLGTAPVGSSNWWDRDLGLGGRVVLKKNGQITTRTVRLPGVIGNIPSLAVHFGEAHNDANPETNMVPVIGQVSEGDDIPSEDESRSPLVGRHNLGLIRAVARELGVKVSDIIDWQLDLFSAEKAQIGGLNREFLYSARLDDKLCSYTAIEGLIQAPLNDHAVQVAALYDDEELGSRSRQGAYGNLLDVASNVIFDSLGATADERKQSFANSLILSVDVTHAAHPNYAYAQLSTSAPHLNKGIAVKKLARFAGDAVSSVALQFVSEHSGVPLQEFAPRNDVRSGGTIGNMLAASTGIRTADLGIPILSMHSIRETTGVRDVYLGIKWFKSFYTIVSQLPT